MAILSANGKYGISLNLLSKKVDIEDTSNSSKYFVITEFNPIFTGGKNAVAFNGSTLLKEGSEIQVECIDSSGTALYLEQAKATDNQYTDSSKFVISIHVYEETYNGAGKLVLVGTTKKGEIVRWIGNVTIDKTLNNVSKVRFIKKPTIEARSLLYPVVDTNRAQVSYPPPPTPSGATGVAVIRGVVQSIRVVTSGAGYSSVPAVIINGGGGSGATAHAVLSGQYVYQVIIDDPGEGYTSTPTVLISGGGASTPATAEATIRNTVHRILITDGGSGYVSVPSVRISGGGTGATAQAFLTGKSVSSASVITGGNGYTTAPFVIFGEPPTAAAAELNTRIPFTGSFYTYAANPPKGTNRSLIDPKRTEVDYRLVITSSTPADLSDTVFPNLVFNSQMEGTTITLHVHKIQRPFSDLTIPSTTTASFTIKKVIDSQTVQLSDAFYYMQGKNNIITDIVSGRCFVSYRFINYNTNPDSALRVVVSPSLTVNAKESYADITYRNIEPFSGFIARHKVYRKSSLSTGDFQLISDELLQSNEMLVDSVTFNKFYDRLGVFYHDAHINKYWFAQNYDEKPSIALVEKMSPINSMQIYSGVDYSLIDGTNYVIAKNDSIGITNDAQYYPYTASQFNSLSGRSYNCNFVDLKKDTQYILSFNASIDKDRADENAKVSFYFTSSMATMRGEKTFTKTFGLKLGEIYAPEMVSTKYFNKRQEMFFTPQDDYYGTLVIVPYHCNVTLSDVSLKAYGDTGFSPDVLSIKIPFPINVTNEAFDIKAELLDRNSAVVFSDLRTVQSFDERGESLYYSNANSTAGGVSVSKTTSTTNVVVSGDPYFPDLTMCPDAPTRLVGWQIQSGDPDAEEGKLCYTNVSNLYISGSDYISLSSVQDGIEYTAMSLAVRYNIGRLEGRKIFVNASGTKTELP